MSNKRYDLYLDPEDPDAARIAARLSELAARHPAESAIRRLRGGVLHYSFDGRFEEEDEGTLEEAAAESYRPLEITVAFPENGANDMTDYLIDGFESFVAPVVDRFLHAKVKRIDRWTQRTGNAVYVHLVPLVSTSAGTEERLYRPPNHFIPVVQALDPDAMAGYRFLTSDPLFFHVVGEGSFTLARDDVKFFDGFVGIKTDTRSSRYIDGLLAAIREATKSYRQRGYQTHPSSLFEYGAVELEGLMDRHQNRGRDEDGQPPPPDRNKSRSEKHSGNKVRANDGPSPYSKIARSFGFQILSESPLVYRVGSEEKVSNYYDEAVPSDYPNLPSQEEEVMRAEDLAASAARDAASPPSLGLRKVLPAHFGTPDWLSESAERIENGLLPLFTFGVPGRAQEEGADSSPWEKPQASLRLWYAAVSAYAELAGTTHDAINKIEQIAVHRDGSASVPASTMEEIVAFDSRLDVENMDRWTVVAYPDFVSARNARTRAVMLQSDPGLKEAARSVLLPYDGYYYLVSKVRGLEEMLASGAGRSVGPASPLPGGDDWTSRGLLPFSFFVDGTKYESGLLS